MSSLLTSLHSFLLQAVFRAIAAQGVFLNHYYAVTHPSEPNYVASVGGSPFGMGDDNLYHIPPKCVSTSTRYPASHLNPSLAFPLLWIFWRQRISLGHLIKKTYLLMVTKVSSEPYHFFQSVLFNALPPTIL
jgi:hypothetical protein